MSDNNSSLYARISLSICLRYWERNYASLFPGEEQTALALMASCVDGGKAPVSPLPWLALADFIEEHGLTTDIRKQVGRAYDLSGLGE